MQTEQPAPAVLTGSAWEKYRYLTVILCAFIVSRVLFYFIGLMGHINFGTGEVLTMESLFNMWDRTADSFCSFDCYWYSTIAEFGYDHYPHGLTTGHASNWAFMPVYPGLARLLHELLGITVLDAFYVISNLCFLIALVFIAKCFLLKGVADYKIYFVIFFMCFCPYEVYFIAPYTESLFLMLTAMLFYCSYRRLWLAAAVCGFFMTGTKVLGVMSVFVILTESVRAYGIRSFLRLELPAMKSLLAVFIVPMPFFLLMTFYYYYTGDPESFKNIQFAWGRSVGNPFDYWYSGLMTGGRKTYMAVSIVVGYLLALVLIWRRLYSEFIFMIICITVPILTSINTFPRYLFGLFPTYIALYELVRKNSVLRYILLTCGAATATYFTVAWVNSKFFAI